MNTIAKPALAVFHLPSWLFLRQVNAKRRRKQATIDLIHSSPHLLRDIGADQLAR